MSEAESLSTRPAGHRGPPGAWVAGPVLLALAILLWADPLPFQSPVASPTEVPAWATDPTTIRQPKLRPEIEHAGMTYRCGECHFIFPSPRETTRSLFQHRHIELKHGINDRCFNCHHRENRNAFVDNKGGEIPYDQPQLLCAKCHGPVYRDWTHGVHGRTNGYWDTQQGPMQRKKCIECHDPHVPPFPPMFPAPGPNTLRMGDQHLVHPDPDEQTNPLLIYRQEVSPAGQEQDR